MIFQSLRYTTGQRNAKIRRQQSPSPLTAPHASLPGEGFHNYHHAFPYNYSVTEYGWHVSLTTFFIDCMAALGLAYDHKRMSKTSVLARIKKKKEPELETIRRAEFGIIWVPFQKLYGQGFNGPGG